MGKASRKVAGGKLVRAEATAVEGKISTVKITGDFFLHPEDTLMAIEESIIGKEENALEETITKTIEEKNASLYGVTASDFAEVIAEAMQ